MTAVLIFISFMLNVLSLLAIVLLFTRQNRLYNIEKRQKKLIKETEGIMESYLLALKEENEAFINDLAALHRQEDKGRGEAEVHQEQDRNSTVFLKKEELETDEGIPSISLPRVQKAHVQKAYQRNMNTSRQQEESAPFIQEGSGLIKQVLSLREEGLSADDIAKQLGKGRTEVELALKFAEPAKKS